MDPMVQGNILTAAGQTLQTAGWLITNTDPSLQTQIAPALHELGTCAQALIAMALPGIPPTPTPTTPARRS